MVGIRVGHVLLLVLVRDEIRQGPLVDDLDSALDHFKALFSLVGQFESALNLNQVPLFVEEFLGVLRHHANFGHPLTYLMVGSRIHAHAFTEQLSQVRLVVLVRPILPPLLLPWHLVPLLRVTSRGPNLALRAPCREHAANLLILRSCRLRGLGIGVTLLFTVQAQLRLGLDDL